MQAKSAETQRSAHGGDASGDGRKKRTSLTQFLKEVRLELRRVNWPSRKEVVSYSVVVLVAVSLLTLYVAVIDQAFGQLVLWMYQ